MRSPRPPYVRALALLVLLCVVGSARERVQGEDAAEKPLPLTRTTVLRDAGSVYVVEGRQEIPPEVEIKVQRGVHIRGKEIAVLEVQGAFVVHGIDGTVVPITDAGSTLVKGSPRTSRGNRSLLFDSTPHGIVTDESGLRGPPGGGRGAGGPEGAAGQGVR